MYIWYTKYAFENGAIYLFVCFFVFFLHCAKDSIDDGSKKYYNEAGLALLSVSSSYTYILPFHYNTWPNDVKSCQLGLLLSYFFILTLVYSIAIWFVSLVLIMNYFLPLWGKHSRQWISSRMSHNLVICNWQINPAERNLPIPMQSAVYSAHGNLFLRFISSQCTITSN